LHLFVGRICKKAKNKCDPNNAVQLCQAGVLTNRFLHTVNMAVAHFLAKGDEN